MRRLFAALVSLALPAFAQSVPLLLDHSGYLLDAMDAPLTATIPITFELHTAEVADALVWSSTPTVNVTKGYYGVRLGEATPIDATVFENGELYLQLVVNGTKLSPRRRVTSTPYALRARDFTATNTQTVFRITADGLGYEKPPSASFAAFTPAVGTATIVSPRPFSWTLTFNGNYQETSSQYRVRLRFTRNGVHTYLPDAAGMQKYCYYDHSRLDSNTFVGTAQLAPGTYSVQLEVLNTTYTHKWYSQYGEIALVIH